MDYYYLLGKNKKPKGPYKLSRLRELWEAGEIPAGTRCCMKGEENWIPIESLAEFFSEESRQSHSEIRIVPPDSIPPDSKKSKRGTPALVAIILFAVLGWQCTNFIEIYSGGTVQEKKSVHELAEQGNTMAQYNLGVMYYKGQGMEKDAKKAVSWFRKAAENNLPLAQYNLGVIYRDGEGVEKDEQIAFEWFLKAAKQNFALSQFNLGVMLVNGIGVEKDEKEAVSWWHRAAKLPPSSSQRHLGNILIQQSWRPRLYYNLGYAYAAGLGVEKDEKEAVNWYRKSADQNFTPAQFDLGVMYANGMGVEKDEKEAIRWYRKAAEQNDPDAQFNLGVMHENGQGVEQDEKEAVKWYRKASEQGDEDAKAALKRLSER